MCQVCGIGKGEVGLEDQAEMKMEILITKAEGKLDGAVSVC